MNPSYSRARALLERQIIYMTSQSREPRSRDHQAQPKCRQDGAKHRTKEQRHIQNPLPYYRPRKAGREPRSHSKLESRGKIHSRTSEREIAEGEASTEPDAEESAQKGRAREAQKRGSAGGVTAGDDRRSSQAHGERPDIVESQVVGMKRGSGRGNRLRISQVVERASLTRQDVRLHGKGEFFLPPAHPNRSRKKLAVRAP